MAAARPAYDDRHTTIAFENGDNRDEFAGSKDDIRGFNSRKGLWRKWLESERAASRGNPEARNSPYLAEEGYHLAQNIATFIPKPFSTTYMPFELELDLDEPETRTRPSRSLEEQNDAVYQSHRLSSQDATRVFDLEFAVEESQPLQCNIGEVSLNRPSSYIALSYAWGSKLPWAESSVHCGQGLRLRIGHNLTAALTAIRSLWSRWRPERMLHQPSPTLWVDAICINQRNPAERFDQVMLMKRVYRNADSLIIWLGAASNQEHLEILRRLEREDLERVVRSEDIDRLRALCSDLVEREWFYRRWIVQEVAVSDKTSLASKILLEELAKKYPRLSLELDSLYGRYQGLNRFDTVAPARNAVVLDIVEKDMYHEPLVRSELEEITESKEDAVSFENYIDLVARLRRIVPEEFSASSANRLDGKMTKSTSRRYFLIGEVLISFETVMKLISSMSTIPRPLQPLMAFRQHSLLESLLLYDGAKCSDQRDLVYALYGISRIGNREDFRWDYSTTDFELFESVAHMYTNSDHLGLLLMCAVGRELGSSSWIPDWRLPIRYRSGHHKEALGRFRRSLLDLTFLPKSRQQDAVPAIISKTELYIKGCPISCSCLVHGFAEAVEGCLDCSARTLSLQNAAGAQPGLGDLILNVVSQQRCHCIAIFLENCRVGFVMRQTENFPAKPPQRAAYRTLTHLYAIADCFWIPDWMYVSRSGVTLYERLKYREKPVYMALVGSLTSTFTQRPPSLLTDWMFDLDGEKRR